MYLFTGSFSEDPAMSVRYLHHSLGVSDRKCLDWHCTILWVFIFLVHFISSFSSILSSKSFPVLGNVTCWCCHVFWFGKTNLAGAIDAELSLSGPSGQAGGRAQGWGLWVSPSLEEPSLPSLCAQPLCWLDPALLWAQREWEFSAGRKPRYWSRSLKVPARISV